MTTQLPIISVQELGIRFRDGLPNRRLRTWVGRALQGMVGRGRHEEVESRWFWALQHVSFDVYEGDSVGLVGLNGAGKSTLIQALAGIYAPSEGRVQTRGKVTAVLGLNSGFVPDISGRENIYLVGLLLGFSEPEMRRLAPEIIEFSGLGSAVDRPVKYYSSGMKSRLGFAIVSSLEPDILLLDEILSVGDDSFRKRCQERLDQMLKRARTIMLCSHSLETIRKQCQRTLWLHKGQVRAYGPTDEVLKAYEQFLEGLDESALFELRRKSRRSIFEEPDGPHTRRPKARRRRRAGDGSGATARP